MELDGSILYEMEKPFRSRILFTKILDSLMFRFILHSIWRETLIFFAANSLETILNSFAIEIGKTSNGGLIGYVFYSRQNFNFDANIYVSRG